MTSLFTPDELPRMAKTLKTLETTIDAIVCADESQHVRNHSWDRLDNRKRVKQALRARAHEVRTDEPHRGGLCNHARSRQKRAGDRLVCL